MSLDRNDRAQLEDILARNKLTDFLVAVREVYQRRTQELRDRGDADAAAFAERHGLILDAVAEARLAGFAARMDIETTIGSAACIALETEMELG